MKKRCKKASFCSLSLACLAFLVTGCAGDFSYKRGAGMDDLGGDRETCARSNKTDQKIEECLQDRGWVLVASDKSESANPHQATDQSTGKAKTADDVSPQPMAAPLDKVMISSWWKPGAGPDQLLNDGTRCAMELGDNYKPEANMSVVRRGLLDCMKDGGWLAHEVSASSPPM